MADGTYLRCVRSFSVDPMLKRVDELLNKREQGITLIELLVVIVVIGLAASVAVPTYSSIDDVQLELVGREVQRTIRHARNEAIRTGKPYGVEFSSNDTRLRLYKYDTEQDYSVYHPVDRQLIDLSFASSEQPVFVSNKSIQFEARSENSQSYIVFSGGTGVPVSDNEGSTSLLEQASIELSYSGNTVAVEVAPITGEVTLQ